MHADINECSQNETNACDQLCINTDGSFMCACEEGYEFNEETNQCEGDCNVIIINNTIMVNVINIIKTSMSVIKSTTAIKSVKIHWAPLSVAVMRVSFLLMMEKIALVSHCYNIIILHTGAM